MDEQVYVGGLYLAAHDCGRSFMECNRRRMGRVLGYYWLVAMGRGCTIMVAFVFRFAWLAGAPSILAHVTQKLLEATGLLEFFFVPTTV